MPGWLQAFTAHQAVSYAAGAVRALTVGGPAATAVVSTLAWSVGILAVFATLAIRHCPRTSVRWPDASPNGERRDQL
ncbi:MAG TPA: hypothetical protein VME46_09630, partial [Acidimicrobiales bacterium]|nr:hypothetical protein [Acidimicrobiales bacterium]